MLNLVVEIPATELYKSGGMDGLLTDMHVETTEEWFLA
jgi:hypothetical protein